MNYQLDGLYGGIKLSNYITKYNTDERGAYYEDFIKDLMFLKGLAITSYKGKNNQFDIGENLAGIEIKFDSRCVDMNHLWIETAEKSKSQNKEWYPSGVCREDNSWLYIQGNYDKVWIFAKRDLRDCYELKKCREWAFFQENPYKMPPDNTATGRGFELPMDRANKMAIKSELTEDIINTWAFNLLMRKADLKKIYQK